MDQSKHYLAAWIVFFMFICSCHQPGVISTDSPGTGPYAGYTPPGTWPELFAPGFITTGMYERDVAISPDGREIYFSVFLGDWTTIMVTRTEGENWSMPEVASFARDTLAKYCEPAFAPDGLHLLFLCTEPLDGSEPKPGWQDQNIWMVSRDTNGSWSRPEPLPRNINNGDQFFPSLSGDGMFYFTRMDSATSTASVYASAWPLTREEPVRLPEPVNGSGNTYNACISPDSQCLVACVTGRDTLNPDRPLYIAFFRKNGGWSDGYDLNHILRIEGNNAISPSFSPDGKYFFFATSKRRGETSFSAGKLNMEFFRNRRNMPGNGNSDIYWVDASVILDMDH